MERFGTALSRPGPSSATLRAAGSTASRSTACGAPGTSRRWRRRPSRRRHARALRRRAAAGPRWPPTSAAAGVCVISGLALGIDAAAHEGALAAGAPTVGVLGGGHDASSRAATPNWHAGSSPAGGAVLSPYPPEHPAQPWQFLARNGVVAALADGVVVVEAAARSGALNTASWAADRGDPGDGLPGRRRTAPRSPGCLALIRDGAILVRDAADVLAQLGLRVAPPGAAAAPARAGRPGGASASCASSARAAADADALVAALRLARGRSPGADRRSAGRRHDRRRRRRAAAAVAGLSAPNGARCTCA